MANYPQELAQDAVCHSHTGHITGLCFLPSPAFKAEYYLIMNKYLPDFIYSYDRQTYSDPNIHTAPMT